MIYTNNPVIDSNNIIRYADEFFVENEMSSVQINSYEVYEVCLKMRTRFPHVDGLSKASVFKKVANFVAHFLEIRPIKTLFPEETIKGLVSYDINAVVALDIALTCLYKSTIKLNGGVKTVSNPIYISNHSYADIVQALSSECVNQKTHYHLLSVLFEQLTYKTNDHCEYKGGDSDNDSYYNELLPGGDDLYGA